MVLRERADRTTEGRPATTLGEELIMGMRHRVRMAPWEERIAPMDPEG